MCSGGSWEAYQAEGGLEPFQEDTENLSQNLIVSACE